MINIFMKKKEIRKIKFKLCHIILRKTLIVYKNNKTFIFIFMTYNQSYDKV